MNTAYHQAREMLLKPNRPEAFFCASDYMALGCYQAIRDLNLKIPDDVAVMGYDNLQIAHDAIPAMTTMQIPYYDMGKLAVEMLLDVMNKVPIASNQFKIEGSLILRNSI